MKRTLDQIETRLEAAADAPDESIKRRNISPGKGKADHRFNKIQTVSNSKNNIPQVNGFQSEFSSIRTNHLDDQTKLTVSNQLNNTFPLFSNLGGSGNQSWDPIWGQQGPWLASRKSRKG